MNLSDKQELAWNLLEDPQVTELDYGGAAGGGKSLLFCLWMTVRCRKYPGIREGIGRKEIKRLKETTVVTLLGKAFPILGVAKSEYNYNSQSGVIEFDNGSKIILVDLAYQPSDPDFDSLGSLELTDAIIEEAGEIVKKAKDVFGSRKNRWLNVEYGLVGKTLLGQNPSQNFTRSEFYEPYKAAGGGDYQKWESGQVEVNGEMVTAYKAFVKALPTDNPFLDRNYIEVLNNLPPQERKRLREGNWDYMSTDDMLFPSQLLDKAMTGELSEEAKRRKFIGVDVSDQGNDKTIATLIDDGIVVKQQRLIPKPYLPISEGIALELIRFAQQNGITREQARDIAVEGNGVGVGTRDFMKSKGWAITEYVATAKTRSQGLFNTSQDMDRGDLQIYNQLETLPDIRKQLMILTYEFNEALDPVVISKKKIKEVLGHSPDESDSMYIANWVRRGSAVTANSGRILF